MFQYGLYIVHTTVVLFCPMYPGVLWCQVMYTLDGHFNNATSDEMTWIWPSSRSYYYQLNVHNLMNLAFKMDSIKITETLFKFQQYRLFSICDTKTRRILYPYSEPSGLVYSNYSYISLHYNISVSLIPKNFFFHWISIPYLICFLNCVVYLLYIFNFYYILTRNKNDKFSLILSYFFPCLI